MKHYDSLIATIRRCGLAVPGLIKWLQSLPLADCNRESEIAERNLLRIREYLSR